MALVFQVADLISAIQNVQKAIAKAESDYAINCQNARDKARNTWWGEHREDVRNLRDYLTRSLRNDTPPLTAEGRKIMRQRDGYSSDDVKLFHGGGNGGVRRPNIGYQRPDELNGLLELLQASAEPTVSATQLKSLGIHPGDLVKLFRAVAIMAGKTT